jgi:hypothetical protein
MLIMSLLWASLFSALAFDPCHMASIVICEPGTRFSALVLRRSEKERDQAVPTLQLHRKKKEMEPKPSCGFLHFWRPKKEEVLRPPPSPPPQEGEDLLGA